MIYEAQPKMNRLVRVQEDDRGRILPTHNHECPHEGKISCRTSEMNSLCGCYWKTSEVKGKLYVVCMSKRPKE